MDNLNQFKALEQMILQALEECNNPDVLHLVYLLLTSAYF